MGLDLTTIRTRGRADKTPAILASGVLTAEQLEHRSTREVGIEARPLQRLTVRHREIARAVASGDRTGEIAARFGLTASRVSVLKADPAFQELVACYQTQRDLSGERVTEVIGGVRDAALLELWDRLDEEPSEIATDELLKIVTATSDRTGFGPKRTEEKNVNFNFGEELAAARNRVKDQARSVIETDYEELPREVAE